MDRLACVDVVALPLQLVAVRRPEWAGEPVAIVDKETPRGVIAWVNRRAHAQGVRAGQRYSAALALCPGLRACAVSPTEIAECVTALVERLRRFSPAVEPHADEPGVFWLEADGLLRLFPSLEAWGQEIRRDLLAAGFNATLAVGFTRFGVYAVAKARATGLVVFDHRDAEQRAMQRVPLARIALDGPTRAALAQLAVHTVGDFMRLPANGLARRLGAPLHRLHRLARGDAWAPLPPRPEEATYTRTVELDDAESNTESLTFFIKQELHPLLSQLATRGLSLAELQLDFTVERHGALTERVRPAAPTLDGQQLLDLVRLRLESLALPAGVVRLQLTPRTAAATVEQLRLFDKKPRRDLQAAARAIARVRALLGQKEVVRARLADGHLPEAQFAWEPTDRLPLAEARPTALSLIRRIELRPVPLAPRTKREPDGWLLSGLMHGPVEKLSGPYLLSGGWWQGEVERDYYFARLRSGAIEWVYYDRKRQRWFRQGRVA